jgi:putative tryptophan/tyrosine transport system substrate-binding protein
MVRHGKETTMLVGRTNRREFIAGLGGAAAWPVVARAQQSAMPVIGFLNSSSPETYAYLVTAFRQGLKSVGYFEGQNVEIEYRWASGQYDRLPELAEDLVRRRVRVIAATGGSPSALAAARATTTIPIVFSVGVDPLRLGIVASLNRPGGNVTGVSYLSVPLTAKQLELLHEVVPQATAIGLLINPANPITDSDAKEAAAAAQALGLQLNILKASSEGDIDKAFTTFTQIRAEALLVGTDVFFSSRVHQFIALSAGHRLPVCYDRREFVMAGGLMSYGASLVEGYSQVGLYTGQILNGANPADLPVLQPTKFDLVINLKTAKALGIQIPPQLLARADEVIE